MGPWSRSGRRFATLPAALPAALLVALGLAGCTAELPTFGTLRYRGDDFEVWASEGLQACGGTHAYTEAWLHGFRERLGPHVVPQYHVFNWVDDDDLSAAPCETLGACAQAQQNVIYSNRIPHEHEIVHVELDTQDAPPVLSEGAAEAFGTDQPPIELTHDVVEQLLSDVGTIPHARYPAAGRFTRFLIDTYGVDAWMEVVRASPEPAAREGIERAMLDVVGEDVTDVLAAFEQAPACSTAEWRFYDYECGAHPLTDWVDADHWEAEVDVACEDEEAIGPQQGRWWTVHALEITEPGTYALTAHASEGATFELVPCALSCFEDLQGSEALPQALPHVGVAMTDVDDLPLDLPAGRYWFRVQQDTDERAEVVLSLRRVLKR